MLVGYFNFDWGLLWLGITLHAKNAGVSSEFSFTEKYLKEIEERIMNALSNKKSILEAFESEIENIKDFKKLKKLLEVL